MSPKKQKAAETTEAPADEIESTKAPDSPEDTVTNALGAEYEIPLEGEDLDSILDQYAAEERQKTSEEKKKKRSSGTTIKKHQPKKTPSPSREEILARLQEKNRLLLELKKNNSDISSELKTTKDKWLRSVAEFENYRKRSHKEWELLQLQAKADVILEVLNIVDDFERAFTAAEGNNGEFVQGIRMIYQNLMKTLEKFGVKQIDALGQRFDPKYHMAVGQIDVKGKKSGHVVEVAQKGYLLSDTVLRPAKVVIAK